MSWGTDLWDQYANLEKHTDKGIDFVEKYGNFIKDRQKIEFEYAAQLKKLAKAYTPRKKEDDDYQKFSSLRAFRSVLKEIGDLANQHELISDNLGNNVLKEVQQLILELKKERKEYLQEARTEEAVLEKSVRKLEMCKNNYKHAHDAWLQSKSLFEKADSDDNRTKAEVEKSRANMDTKNQFREDQKNEYIIQLQNTNKSQAEYYSTKLPTVFNRLQAVEEKRVTHLGKYYDSYAESHRHVLPIITKCLDSMTQAGQSVTPTEDSRMVIDRYKTGHNPPLDFVMLDLDEPGQNINSDNLSVSSLNGSSVSIGGGQGGTISGKNKRKKGKLFGTVFNKKEEPKDFSHLPPNQQKKKLQEKIDDLTNHIDQEVKSKEALLKMREVYTGNPMLGDPNSVNRQLDDIGKKIDTLRVELNTFQEFKDKADGKISTPQHTPTNSNSTVKINSEATTPKSGGSGDSSTPGNSPSKARPISQSTTSPSFERGDTFFEDEFEDDETDDTARPIGKCTALYEFTSDDSNLLNMGDSEVLDIIEDDSGDGWTRVRRLDGKEEGYVPTSYITKS